MAGHARRHGSVQGLPELVHLTSDATQHGYQDGFELRVPQTSSRRHLYSFLDRTGPRKIARLKCSAAELWKMS